MTIPPSPFATTLAVDCSFAGLSLALRTATGTSHFTTDTPRSSDILPAELQRLLQHAEVTVQQLTTLAVAIGPGSFTGIRLGLATAEALKLLNPAIRIIGLSTLHALAQQVVAEHQPPSPFTLLLDAAGGQVYAQTFCPAGLPHTEATCLATPPIEGLIFAQPSLMHPTARPLATLDARYLLQLAEDPTAHLPPQPVYLKPLTYKKVD